MKLYANCFRDEEIRQFINTYSSNIETNPYIHGDESFVIDFWELADFFSSLFSIYDTDSNGEPLFELIQADWDIFDIKKNGIEIILQAIINELSHPFENSNIRVKHISEIEDCLSYWALLKIELKSQKRFFSDIGSIIDYGWDTLFDVNSIIDKDIPLYRARIHNNMSDARPHNISNMGCPPTRLMTEGRANPIGIPFLYLAKEIETTFYEVRATFLDYISVGTFYVKDDRTLKITDFTKRLSPFNNATDIVSFAKGKLLRDLISIDLSKPLHRFDSHLEYIPTQFICEFIRYFCNSDGIQFISSLKRDGVNFVLFDENNVECKFVKLHQIESLTIISKAL